MRFNKIWTFLLISITMHVIVISLFQENSRLFVAPVTGSTVSVRLVNAPDLKIDSTQNRKSATPVIKKTSTPVLPPVPVNISATNKVIIKHGVSFASIAPSPITSASRTSLLSNNKIIVMKYIQDKLSSNFIYPRIARKKGWQGKVLLGFQLKRNGIIENIYIAKSSGYAILDHAATRSLANIQSIPQSTTKFNYISSDMQLPVIYKLQEG